MDSLPDAASAQHSSRVLVDNLLRPALLDQPATSEDVAVWRQDLDLLADHGPAAVPAIVEFLEQYLDYPFDADTAQLLGYASIRTALFDVLLQIGGAAGLEGTRQILRNTADPVEIALLARNVDILAPETYRPEAVASAREALALAAGGQLPGGDVAPLFEVLAQYGDLEALPDLEQSVDQWKYYATYSLAQLPDNAGLLPLLHLAHSDATGAPSPARYAALQMLTQLAAEDSAARAALLALTVDNRIQPRLWPSLAPMLAGDRLHLESSVLDADQFVLPPARTTTSHLARSNENFYYAPPNGQLSAEQAQLQLDLLNELLAVVSEPEVIRIINESRAQVESRLSP
jgi:hypothetical protein